MGLNPYVFVVGCARSGTTMLQTMLDNHSELVVANDSHFIGKFACADGDAPLTPELVRRIEDYRRYRRLGLPDHAVERAARSAKTFVEFVCALYDALAALHGKPLAGEKTPSYVHQVALLHRLFPQTRFVHIVRDGRDVALSVLDWAVKEKRARYSRSPRRGPARRLLWDEEPIAAIALWWRRQASMGRREGAPLGPKRYHEIRYEDLIDAPERCLASVALFLDLPYEPSMVTGHVGTARAKSGRLTGSPWLPPTSGLRDWRGQMSARDVELFEALAGDVLADYGYECSATGISEEIAGRAEWCRARWADGRVTDKVSTN